MADSWRGQKFNIRGLGVLSSKTLGHFLKKKKNVKCTYYEMQLNVEILTSWRNSKASVCHISCLQTLLVQTAAKVPLGVLRKTQQILYHLKHLGHTNKKNKVYNHVLSTNTSQA